MRGSGFLVGAIWIAWTAACARGEEPRPAPPRTVVNSIGMRLVEIPAGEFLMGSGEDGEELVAAFPEYGRKSADFADDEIEISAHLNDGLQADRHFRRPSA